MESSSAFFEVRMNGFSILGINHIGLAPKDPEKAKAFFEVLLNLPFEGSETVIEQKTETLMLASARQNDGALPRLEILVPTSEDSPIAKFLDQKGSGIHHIALTVSRLEVCLAYLKSQGVQLIDEVPRVGAHRTRIAFVHPKSTGGLLVELVEQSS